MKRGTIHVRNNGVLMPTMIGTVMTRRKQEIHIWKLWAIVTSIVSMSLLNLFIIRPKGVVSKKLMGERAMLPRIAPCRVLPALTLPIYKERAPATTNTPVNRP
jgi:hypothetical protein